MGSEMCIRDRSYCVECYDPADVCFCELEKVILSEYIDGMKECSDLNVIVRNTFPKGDFLDTNPKLTN